MLSFPHLILCYLQQFLHDDYDGCSDSWGAPTISWVFLPHHLARPLKESEEATNVSAANFALREPHEISVQPAKRPRSGPKYAAKKGMAKRPSAATASSSQDFVEIEVGDVQLELPRDDGEAREQQAATWEDDSMGAPAEYRPPRRRVPQKASGYQEDTEAAAPPSELADLPLDGKPRGSRKVKQTDFPEGALAKIGCSTCRKSKSGCAVCRSKAGLRWSMDQDCFEWAPRT